MLLPFLTFLVLDFGFAAEVKLRVEHNTEDDDLSGVFAFKCSVEDYEDDYLGSISIYRQVEVHGSAPRELVASITDKGLKAAPGFERVTLQGALDTESNPEAYLDVLFTDLNLDDLGLYICEAIVVEEDGEIKFPKAEVIVAGKGGIRYRPAVLPREVEPPAKAPHAQINTPVPDILIETTKRTATEAEAPPIEAPPTEAPPTEAPPTEAPPTEALPNEARTIVEVTAIAPKEEIIAAETTTAPIEETIIAAEVTTTAPGETTVALEFSTVAEEETTVVSEETTAAVGPEETTASVGPEETTVTAGPEETTASVGPEETTVTAGPVETTVVVGPEETTVARSETTVISDATSYEETTLTPIVTTLAAKETTLVPEETTVISDATSYEQTTLISVETFAPLEATTLAEVITDKPTDAQAVVDAIAVSVEALIDRMDAFNDTVIELERRLAALDSRDVTPEETTPAPAEVIDSVTAETTTGPAEIDISNQFVHQNVSYIVIKADQATDVNVAQTACESRKYYLTEVNNQGELQAISDEISPHIIEDAVVLVAGQRAVDQDLWLYQGSREQVDFFPWGPGEPVQSVNNECLGLRKTNGNLNMVTVPCSSGYPNFFILCEHEG